MTLRAIEWRASERALVLLDQRGLPESANYLVLRDPAAVADAISGMVMHGASIEGVAAAYGMVLAAHQRDHQNWSELRHDLQAADTLLRGLRSVPIDFSWALNRMHRVWQPGGDAGKLRLALAAEAEAIEREDLDTNYSIAYNALKLLPRDRVTFFHHCSTGALATAGHGTALGIIRSAKASGRDVMVYQCEARPLMLGSRLSAFELQAEAIRHVVVVDGMAAHVIRTRPVDVVVVGCQRVAANGDLVNTSGTYNLALAARDNGVPFYVAAPCASIDLELASGDDFDPPDGDFRLIAHALDGRVTLQETPVVRPSFDVTPARLVSAFITEHGVVLPPFSRTLPAVLQGQRGKP